MHIITEASLVDCVNIRSTLKEEKYDLAFIERTLENVKMDNRIAILETRVWKIALCYEKCPIKQDMDNV